MTESVITLSGVTRDFRTVRALDGLSLTVSPGIVFGFLGPNGAGKTTTLRILLGLLEPTSGMAQVLGFDVAREGDAVRARCGALLEHHGLYERLSAEDNLEFYARAWHMKPAERAARIKELLQGIGLYDRRKELVGGWSRGMKQKLAVVRTLVHRPRLVFLDEPSAGLDPVAANALREDLARLVREEGVTVFLTTHNLVEAEKLCAQVGVIRGGRLLAVGTPEELGRRQQGPRVEILAEGVTPALVDALKAREDVASVSLEEDRLLIGLLGEGRSAPLVRLLVEGGAQVEEVRRERASLEDVFLTLMKEEQAC